MPSTAPVALMHGLWHDGRRHIGAIVQPLKGHDEVALQESDDLVPAARITRLLSAATRAIGDVTPVSEEMIRDLTVADRERLLLALHMTTFGRRQEMVVQCAACNAQIEIPLDVKALVEAGRESEGSRGELAAEIETPAGSVIVRCRPPSGADQEAAVRLAQHDIDAASDTLLLRCIEGVTDGAGARLEPASMLDLLRVPVEALLQASDPLTELRLTIGCPDCGHENLSELDAFQFLKAASISRGSIFADVHRLARAYHWNEADILAMPLARRRLYLALLDTQDDPR
jgi:hypothetical protein